MNNLQIFNNPEFGEIRTIQKNGEPWFVGKDVYRVFGETNRNRAMQALDEDEKGYTQIETPGGAQRMAIVNEAGLYHLLFAMQPEMARDVTDEYITARQAQLKAFKRWVTHEVLPSIRKTGSYTMNRYPPTTSPDGLAKLIGKYEKRMEQMNCSPAEILSMMQHFCLVWSITPPEVVTRHIPEQLCFWDMPGLQGGGPLLID